MFLQYNMGDRRFQYSIPRERTARTDSLPFFAASMGDFCCDGNYYTRREGINQCLLLYTLSGEGLVEYEGEWITLKPFHVLVLDCRKYHYYRTKGDSWHFLWIHFAGKCAFDYVDLLNEAGAQPVYTAGRVSVQGYYEKLAANDATEDVSSLLEMASDLQQLMTELIRVRRSDSLSSSFGRYEQGLERSIALIQSQYARALSVEELAGESRLSKFHFIKVFRAYTGQTPHRYLTSFRILQAKRLLLETQRTVEEIADAVGFSDGKHFISTFKNTTGITPLQFRRQNRLTEFEGLEPR